MIDICSIDTTKLISIENALEIIKLEISPIEEEEQLNLKNALGRILSKSISSPINIPPEKNSAMDGYAFSSHDIISNQSFSLNLVGTSWAGRPYKETLKRGECLRIFTGAVIPIGADSVIMQEQVNKSCSQITFPTDTKAKQHIREIGGDISESSVLISAPKKITAVDMGLIACAGIYDVIVKRKLNIAFFSTGDELVAIGEPLKSGQIYDSNRYTLSGLLKNDQYNVYDLGVIPDDKQFLEETLIKASKNHDLIITTGGASVGEADYIQEILNKIGNVGFWKIAIKPGKPLAFGKINQCYFFGLPGNPVSVITTFHKIVLPALSYLSKSPAKKALQLTVKCQSNLKKQQGRQEYQRGIVSQDGDGTLSVKTAGEQDSNIMSAMSKANCYIVLPIESEGVSKGDYVTVEPFENLI